MLLGLYAEAARIRNVLGHGEGRLYAHCAVALRNHVEEGFAERALRPLGHCCCGLRAGLPDGPVCAQGLPVHSRAGQHEAMLGRSAGNVAGRNNLL